MQNEHFDQTLLDAQLANDPNPQSRTTASERQCRTCAKPLGGRKHRFCSDRCRMRTSRKNRRRTICTLLNVIERALGELRREALR